MDAERKQKIALFRYGIISRLTGQKDVHRGQKEKEIRTIRMQFLPLIPKVITLEKLNERLWQWIDKEYHLNTHSSIKSAPLNRYIKHLQRIKQAPGNLIEYFRKRIIRKVDRDRTVSLMGKVYEAPVELTEKNVSLLYHESELEKIEVFYNNTSYGFLVPLNAHINSRIKRNHFTDIVSEHIPEAHSENKNYCGGKLFNREENDDKL